MIDLTNTRPDSAILTFGYNPGKAQEDRASLATLFTRRLWWEKVVGMFTAAAHRPGPDFRQISEPEDYQSGKLELPFIGPACNGNWRTAGTTLPTSLIFLDFDNQETGNYGTLKDWFKSQQFAWLMHSSTGHHSPVKGGFDAFRAIIPLAEPLPPEQHKAITRELMQIIAEQTGLSAASESAVTGQMFFLPPFNGWINHSRIGWRSKDTKPGLLYITPGKVERQHGSGDKRHQRAIQHSVQDDVIASWLAEQCTPTEADGFLVKCSRPHNGDEGIRYTRGADGEWKFFCHRCGHDNQPPDIDQLRVNKVPRAIVEQSQYWRLLPLPKIGWAAKEDKQNG
ncbi:hypothetical protein [Pantoea sp. ME81]|uniref:hypothetical protein n=1 Tax=Pantoea sp. ME81 TaxID=2743935 RepID=UPI0015F55389|nr:hypothetical protein [Pantoea sp. ME81]